MRAARAGRRAGDRRTRRRRSSRRDGLELRAEAVATAAASSACSGCSGRDRHAGARRCGRARARVLGASGSRATRARGPGWRVPISSPSPRSRRSTSASAEAVAVARPSRSDARSSCDPKSRHTDSCSPRPTRPRSWCSCEMPVALGGLDQHHGRVRDVDPDLDHRVATSTSASPRRSLHRRLLLRGRHLAVKSSTRKSRNSVERAARLGRGRRACSASDSSTSGQTTKPDGRRRSPRGSARRRAAALARRPRRGLDRPAPRGQLAKRRSRRDPRSAVRDRVRGIGVAVM